MVRLSNLADYAVVIMVHAAKSCGSRLNAASVADATGVPAPTAAKLMGVLTRAGLLESSRGVAGGYALAAAPAAISLVDIVEAVDGPIAMTQCTHVEGSDCAIEGRCNVRPHWTLINRHVRNSLAAVSLAEIAVADAPLFEEA